MSVFPKHARVELILTLTQIKMLLYVMYEYYAQRWKLCKSIRDVTYTSLFHFIIFLYFYSISFSYEAILVQKRNSCRFQTVLAFWFLLSKYWFCLDKSTVSTAQTVLRTLLLPTPLSITLSAYVLIFKQVSANAWAGVLFKIIYALDSAHEKSDVWLACSRSRVA
jgi:hypothetical protein